MSTIAQSPSTSKMLTAATMVRKQTAVLWITFFFYFSTYFAKYNIGPSTKLIQDEFMLTNAAMGTIFSVYTAVYAFGQFFAGYFGDRYSTRALLLIGAAISLVANVLFAFSSSLLMFSVFWGLNAFALSLTWGPSAGVMYAWLPEKRWGTWMGILNAMCFFGSAVVVPLAAFLATTQLGWQANFYITPMALGFMAILLFFFVRSTPQKAGYTVDWQEPAIGEDGVDKNRVTVKDYFDCLKNSKFIMTCLVMLCTNFLRWGLINWIIKILAEPLDKGGYGMTLLLAGIVGSSIHWGAAFLSLVTGVISDKLFAGRRWPVISIGLGISSVALFVLSMGPSLMDLPGGVALVVALLFISGGLIQAVMAPMCCLPGDIFGAKLGGTGNGILNGVGYIGAIFAGTLLGSIMDAGGFMMGIISLAIIAAVGTLLSFTIRR